MASLRLTCSHWLHYKLVQKKYNRPMHYLRPPSSAGRQWQVIPSLLRVACRSFNSLAPTRKVHSLSGEQRKWLFTSPTLGLQIGCQCHRQCAFVYVVRTRVPNRITHRPQRGGEVCVNVSEPLTGLGTENGSCNLEIMLVAHFLASYVTNFIAIFKINYQNWGLLHKANVFWYWWGTISTIFISWSLICGWT